MRRRRSPMGGLRTSVRWEIALPLIAIGALTAGATVGVRGGAILFWGGVGLAAVGTALFFSLPRGR